MIVSVGSVGQALEFLEKLLGFGSAIWLLLPFLREQRLGQLLERTRRATPGDDDAARAKDKAARRLQEIQVRFKQRDLIDGFGGLALLCVSFFCGLLALTLPDRDERAAASYPADANAHRVKALVSLPEP